MRTPLDPIPQILVLTPSRGRPDAIAAVIQSWRQSVVGAARLCVALDEDDPALLTYPEIPPEYGFYDIAPRNGFAPRQNELAVRYAPDYFALASFGDDHLPRTIAWDARILSALHARGPAALTYPNDLLQGPNLPTACAMTSDIITTLGWMTPPALQHLYVDNFWLELGKAIENITYLPRVFVEHMHPVAGKTPWDQSYHDSNSPDSYKIDKEAFEHYLATSFPSDVAKVAALREKATADA